VAYCGDIATVSPFNSGMMRHLLLFLCCYFGTALAAQCDFTVSVADGQNICADECTGTLEATVDPPGMYTYVWSNGSTSTNARRLCPGEYTLTVTDANGCEVIDTATVIFDAGVVPIVVEGVVTDVLCNGNCDGAISVTVTGGSPGYSFVWSNGEATADINGLCAGTYSVTVTDANNCEAVRDFNINESGALFATATITGGECDANGGVWNVDFSVTGGTPPYAYQWNTGSTLPGIPETPFWGDFSVTVTDVNGCQTTLNDISRRTRLEGIPFASQYYLTCSEPVPLPVRESMNGGEIVWLSPEGDSLRGAEVVIDTFGTYLHLDFSPQQECVTVSPLTVRPFSSLGNTLLQTSPVAECDTSRCVSLTGIGAEYPAATDFAIEIFDASGDLIFRTSDPAFCADLPGGTFTADVVVGCQRTPLESITLPDIVPCGAVSGTLYQDELDNCTIDADDTPLAENLITIQPEDGGTPYYVYTDAVGYYEVALPNGNYTLIPRPRNPSFPATCPLGVMVDEDLPAQLDLFLPVSDCTELSVEVTLFSIRRCFENCVFVYFDNDGYDPVENATVEVELDPFFEFISANYPIVSQADNRIVFDVGTVVPGERERIIIYFRENCESELGQNHCVSASISPNGFCQSPEDWAGALVNITDARCDADSLRFTIANVGAGEMTVPLSYVVVEDGIMMTPVPIMGPPLAADTEIALPLPARGTTVQITTNQEPNAPVQNQPSSVLEGCGVNFLGGFSTGFTNFLTLGNGVPWEDVACRANVGSYDPNDKYGYPLGYNGGQIEPGTRLDYEIRFQNTGTDTAFTVVIRDTIGPALDLSTLEIEGASHDFTVTLDTNRVLTFTFDNILLPDSNTNLLLSNGIVNFTIDHDISLEPGDFIDNEAAIYFDFNEPVITNVSRHMIALEPLPTSLRRISRESIPISVTPNPAETNIQVRLPADQAAPTDIVVVTDLLGRPLLRRTYGQIDAGLNVAPLPSGYYFLVVTNASGHPRGRTGFVKK